MQNSWKTKTQALDTCSWGDHLFLDMIRTQLDGLYIYSVATNRTAFKDV